MILVSLHKLYTYTHYLMKKKLFIKINLTLLLVVYNIIVSKINIISVILIILPISAIIRLNLQT